MGDRNGEITEESDVIENGQHSEDESVGPLHSAGRFGKSEQNSTKNTLVNGVMKDDLVVDAIDKPSFVPHPPESPKHSVQNSPCLLKSNKKRFERQLQRKLSNESSSDEDRLSTQHVKKINEKRTINASKLPPIKKKGSTESAKSVSFADEVAYEGDVISLRKQIGGSLVPSIKSLAPLKDQGKLVEEFKTKQSLEREKLHENDKHLNGPLKPLRPVEDVHSENTYENMTSNGTKRNDSESEDTLTSVSENDSSISDPDSDSESSQPTVNIFTNTHQPEPPKLPLPEAHRHHNSLPSVRDNNEPMGTHSDTEAVNRQQKARRKSTKELWDKARVVTYLPKVPASKARDRKSNFVQEELEKYLPERKLMIFVGTWNMHGEKQLPLFVDDFLLPSCCQFMQDLYVIGSQESSPLRKEWEIKLQEALGPSHVMIYSCAFGVLHVAMFLRRELVWFCSAVQQATVATRPGHMIKTKGAIGLTVSIFGTTFLFINSHLTAHEPKWKERILDYRLIRRTLSLPLNYTESPTRQTDVTSRFQHVFWFGDFNFRVEERHGVVETFLQQCEEDEDPNYDELVGKDQMTRLMNRENGVFEHFKECKINFPPTYRFDINPDNPGNYSKVRVPSWTDRIVYRSKDDDIKPLHYDHCTSLIISDHRPVYGIFEATIKPVKDRVAFTGVHFVRDVYIEANRRRASPPRNQNQTSVCTIL